MSSNCTWKQIKSLVESKGLQKLIRYKLSGKRYEVSFEYDGHPRMSTRFNVTSRDGVDFTTNFVPLIIDTQKIDSDGNTPVTIQPPVGTALNFYSHNLCDRSTWYTESVLISNMALTSSDSVVFASGMVDWIDVSHGRVYREDVVSSLDPSLIPVIETSVDGVNWIVRAEDSLDGLAGDFSIDYSVGTVTFHSPLPVGATVRATFRVADKFVFYITPDAGKVLKIIYAEIQHTNPLNFNSSVIFQTQVYNPFSLPNRVNYGQPVKYKTIRDFEQEARGSYAVKPPRGGVWEVFEAIGDVAIKAALNAGGIVVSTRHDGTNWISLFKRMTGNRGFNSEQTVVPLPYNSYRPLDSSNGVRIKLTLGGDGKTPMGGEFANVTFYCKSDSI